MNMCDFGQNTNESLTLRKEFISEQKNEYYNITCRAYHSIVQSVSKKKRLKSLHWTAFHQLSYGLPILIVVQYLF